MMMLIGMEKMKKTLQRGKKFGRGHGKNKENPKEIPRKEGLEM